MLSLQTKGVTQLKKWNTFLVIDHKKHNQEYKNSSSGEFEGNSKQQAT